MRAAHGERRVMEKVNQVLVRRALLSVSDKEGLIPLATRLRAFGVELLATGGTYAVCLLEHPSTTRR